MPQFDVRLYAELNDHLPPRERQAWLRRQLGEGGRVRDLLRDLEVPPAEVDLVLIDGRSASLDDAVPGGARVSLYPVFERLDLGALSRVRPRPLRTPRFAVEAGLERLALALRLLGLPAFSLEEAPSRRGAGSEPILLTRDPALPRRLGATHALVVRERRAARQAREVISALQLESVARAGRGCARCGAPLEGARCPGCGRRSRGRCLALVGHQASDSRLQDLHSFASPGA